MQSSEDDADTDPQLDNSISPSLLSSQSESALAVAHHTSPVSTLLVAPNDVSAGRGAASPSTRQFLIVSHEDQPSDPESIEQSIHTRRSNAFVGPPSTWLFWTREERTVGTALHRERAQNLGVHLYNAYAVKTFMKQSTAQVPQSDSLNLFSSAFQGNEKTLILPSQWTAWPIPSEEVPCETLMPRLDGNRRADNETPSQILIDCIIATSSRKARRMWEGRAPDCATPQATTGAKKADTKGQTRTFDTSSNDSSDDVSGHLMFSSRVGAEHEIDSQESAFASDDIKGKYHTKSIEEANMTPVPMADDSRAHKLLQPSTRHITSKLDGLLMGLHKARSAYANRQEAAMTEDDTSDEESETNVGSSRSRGRSLSRSRKRKRGSSVGTAISAISALSTQQRSGNRKRLGQRNWSDVLGLAALTGWNQEVVDRAGERCAAIFRQDMLFRTFHEGSKNDESYFTEQLATGREPGCDEVSRVESEDSEGGHPNATFKSEKIRRRCCPYPSCNRHDDPFVKQSGLRRHLRAIHNDERANFAPVHNETSTLFAGVTSGISCPVEGCKRENYSFSARSKLYRHLRTYHPQFDLHQFKQTEQIRSGEKRGGHRTPSASRHGDYFCPVTACPSAEFPFQKAEYLRQHMRRRHPGMDRTVMPTRVRNGERTMTEDDGAESSDLS